MNCGPFTGLRPSETAGEEPDSISHALPPKGVEKPPQLRSVLTRPVLISISSYAMLVLLTMAAIALIPLVWSTSVELGGLGLSPASIGLWMSGYGCMNGIAQYVFLPRLVSRFGPRGVFLTSVSMCALIYAMFPFENLAFRHASGGPKVAERLLIMLQLSSLCVADMGFSKSIPFSWLRAGTDGARIHQASYTCTFLLPFPTSDRWARRMASRRWWCRSNGWLDQPQQTGCLRSP